MIKINCKVCGKEKLVYLCKIKQKKGIYCSKQCYYKDRSIRLKNGEIKTNFNYKIGLESPSFKHGFWSIYRKIKNGEIINKCQNCNLKLSGRRLHIHHKDRNHSNNYMENIEILCSKCHGLKHRTNLTSFCKKCGERFNRFQSEIRKFCSKKCMYSFRKENGFIFFRAGKLLGECKNGK